ncbi:amidase [Candidatus Entotheonella palauensis]|uniref:amidase n=1 Tax=Candidatus Entotheonella palauensis TaxID=93172 RepID=UPI000B7CF1B9|nr:amidase [Candidatus Entotheonella palauensis]
MPVSKPTHDQLREIAQEMGLSLTDGDVKSFIGLMQPYIDGYNEVDAMPDALPAVKYPRTPGYRPSGSENKYNAWYVKTAIKGAPSGVLSGKRVVIKDNVMVAGVPMMNGASTLEGYVPEIDATIVERILDAGGEIAGKAHCESFCLSGGSHTNATGAVHNPHKMGYSAGGSSSGSAALVAAGEADMAIGGDQGGSIRIPAAYCGIYGMKPTHGLVPYTGIMPIEIYIDHTGPMTANVTGNALLLDVIAGPDGYDPRQYHVKTDGYTAQLTGDIAGMSIGVVREGFGHANSEPDVDAKVRAAGQRLQSLGAKVEEVSIPWHLSGGALWLPIGLEGLTQTMMWGDGYGFSRPDLYVTSLMDFHRGWRQRADELSETTKLFTLFGTYIRKRHGSRYYGKAMNITRQLIAAYDQVLSDYDLLLMPTLPLKATPLPAPDASREDYVARALEMIANTAPFDISHHPAMAIPCGMSDGLPISMMLVGKHFDEATIYRAACAFEQSGDWKSM